MTEFNDRLRHHASMTALSIGLVARTTGLNFLCETLPFSTSSRFVAMFRLTPSMKQVSGGIYL